MGNEPKKMGVLDWVGVVIAAAYVISPIDLIPDIPVIGWIDDFFVAVITALNVIEKTIGKTIPLLAKIAKISKIILIFLGIIIVLLILLLGTTIAALIGK